jgi:hypothetical protein
MAEKNNPLPVRTPYRKPEHLAEVCQFIRDYRDEHGYSPNNRELAEAFPTPEGFPRSTAVVRYWYRRMVEAGLIRYDPGIARGVVPL